MRKNFITLLLTLFLMGGIRLIAKKTIVILPFKLIGVDEITALTSNSILTRSLDREGGYKRLPENILEEVSYKENCLQVQCAVNIGKELNADEVLAVELAALGEVIIVQYIIVDAKNDSLILSEQTKAQNIEDLERVMKRIAISVKTGEPIIEGAEVGNILASEGQKKMRRKTFSYFGILFGYLYPTDGYSNGERTFTVDARLGYDINDYSLGLNFGARDGFMMNIYGDYYFTKTDICPYVGAGFGFHWVSHSDYHYIVFGDNYNNDRKTDGFELLINVGIKFLRTYNFQFLTNLAYAYTFNDFDDKALVFTL